MNFKPNLFGKICFVILCTLIVLLDHFVFRYISTHYILLDLIIWISLLIGSAWLVAIGLEKFLLWVSKLYEK